MHPAALKQELILGILHHLAQENQVDHILTKKVTEISTVQLQQSLRIVPQELRIFLKGQQPAIQVSLELVPAIKGLILQAGVRDLGPQQTSHL